MSARVNPSTHVLGREGSPQRLHMTHRQESSLKQGNYYHQNMEYLDHVRDWEDSASFHRDETIQHRSSRPVRNKMDAVWSNSPEHRRYSSVFRSWGGQLTSHGRSRTDAVCISDSISHRMDTSVIKDHPRNMPQQNKECADCTMLCTQAIAITPHY